MVKPFISFAPHRQQRAEWVGEIFKALGFEEPILTAGWDPNVSRKKVNQELEKADCFLALLSPELKESGEARDPTRPGSWIEQDLAVAARQEIPVALLWEKGIIRSPAVEQLALASEEADFDNPENLLVLAPKVVSIGNRMRSFFEKTETGEEFIDFVCDKVNVLYRFMSEQEWHNVRTISLTSVKHAKEIQHAVDVGMDRAPGISVKLANPDQDLRVTCRADPTRIDPQEVRNTDQEVTYKIVFTPFLKAGETIVYRHESHHQNIFPMTVEAVKKRARLPGSPPFMKDGYVGMAHDVVRPIDTLILGAEAPLSLGLTSPQVRVYATMDVVEYEHLSSEIGTPDSKPRLWKVEEDMMERWTCQVTIRKPRRGYSYCLLVRPTK